MCVCMIFFFFKQKTAYEMRISDWSSDVCSSDLNRQKEYEERGDGCLGQEGNDESGRETGQPDYVPAVWLEPEAGKAEEGQSNAEVGQRVIVDAPCHEGVHGDGAGRKCADDRCSKRQRSEEHTSELKSLMRILY